MANSFSQAGAAERAGFLAWGIRRAPASDRMEPKRICGRSAMGGRRMRVLLGAGLLCLLVGCASVPVGIPLTHRRIGESPALRVPVSRSVGEVIYETFNYEEWQGARLLEPITIDVLAADASLGPSDALIASQEAGATVYCTEKPALRAMSQPASSRICLADRDGDTRFEMWRAPEGPPARVQWAKLQASAAFSVGHSMAPTGNGFRYELLYQGVSANVIRILYREYVDDLIRPAFQQDLSYTLSPSGPTDIAFRTSRIRVTAADNNGIQYEMLAGLGAR